ncbi:MAG: PDR/VanB family oxidoreductase [Ideonella sp.]
MNSSATLRVKVARKATEAEGIASFDLVSADGSALPCFTAGAHIDVHLAGGLLRQYSLCNSPAETHRYQLAVLREPASRGGSQAMHEQVHEGDVLTISAPRNQFALQPRADKHLLLAGGIGITPIKAMAEALAVARLPFALHYAARSASRMAFADALTAAPWGAQVVLHRDDGPDEQRLDLPRLLADPAPGCHLYVCGPTGFIDAVMSTARAQGWPEDRLHCEHFGAAPLIAEGDQPFEVQIASSGRVIPIAAGQRITDALSAAGVFVSTSCEQGVCGTCLTRVISGVPEHHDTYLLPEEQAANDQCLPCCARSRSARLVLDL